MTSTVVVGSTGLTGSYILSTLLDLSSISTVHTLARRAPSSTSPKLTPHISSTTSDWSSLLASITPAPSIFYSALGTTRAQAGSVEAQRLIDYDLNLELARKAKETGVKVYVLISSTGASSTSRLPYGKMKGELEESVKELGFEHTVILRPGLIVGGREGARPVEFVLRKVAGLAGTLAHGLKDFWAQDADVIAKAAVSAGLKALEGGAPGKVWELGQSDIVKLGRTEWKA
ncbi:hypothetical protein B0O99DRAFT_681178 [Bisporella sp. PMI_857]|nr:hypothetical protein B0O99DRAFT_681178 [Bisporella sp. PMI_857]